MTIYCTNIGASITYTGKNARMLCSMYCRTMNQSGALQYHYKEFSYILDVKTSSYPMLDHKYSYKFLNKIVKI
jgi:uncharacterized protein YlbG (UPF0298 family)